MAGRCWQPDSVRTEHGPLTAPGPAACAVVNTPANREGDNGHVETSTGCTATAAGQFVVAPERVAASWLLVLRWCGATFDDGRQPVERFDVAALDAGCCEGVVKPPAGSVGGCFVHLDPARGALGAQA